MTCNKKMRRAWTPGAALAGVALAALLAGCGGGGGGGSSPTSPTPTGPTPTPTTPEVRVAGPVTVSAGSGATSVGSVTAAPPTPEVDIPAGTAPATAISVSIYTDPNAPALPAGFAAESAVYDIQPSGAQFSGAGITIKLPYNGAASNPSFLEVYYYDAPSSTWKPVGSGGYSTSTTDTTNHDVAAQAAQIAAGRTNGSGPADYVVLGPPTPPTTPTVKAQ